MPSSTIESNPMILVYKEVSPNNSFPSESKNAFRTINDGNNPNMKVTKFTITLILALRTLIDSSPSLVYDSIIAYTLFISPSVPMLSFLRFPRICSLKLLSAKTLLTPAYRSSEFISTINPFSPSLI